jgi:uncharacterized protein (TIGR02302 family)
MTEAAEKPRFSRRLTRTRFATHAAMVIERLWPLVLPLLVALSLFASLSWFGAFRVMPDAMRFGILAAFAVAAVASLSLLRFYRPPRVEDVDRRIEAANALLHTPLRAQTDRPAGKQQDGFSDALWREHQKRMAERLDGLGGDLPRTGVPQRDPFALRAAAALLVVTAFAFSFGSRGGTLEDAFRAVAFAETVPARIDAWVTPPPYTGKAPIFLTAEGNEKTPVFTVPTGSDVILRITGGSGGETVSFTDSSGETREIEASAGLAEGAETPDAQPVAAAGGASAPRQFTGKLSDDGVLALQANGREIDRWAFAVTPDRPPVIRFSGVPRRAVNGAFELHYEIEDDYGAASAAAAFALEKAPPTSVRPLYGPPEMPLSVPRRGSKDIAMKATRDLTEHVWAGSRIKLTLSAVDDAGQEAETETKTLILPERPFTNPLAKSVVELRKIFSLDANMKRHVVDLIDAITLRPEDTFDNPSHYLGLMAARTRLKLAGTDEALRETADYLWNMALQIEDGDLSDAEKRLRQAQEALKQALRDGASDEEIDRLMKELRQAMNEFLREFAERAARDPNMSQQQPQNGQELSQRDLERMMDQIENLAKSGNRQQAEELLSQLQDMMNNLQARRQQQPGESGQQSEMREQMNKLGEIMRRQQEMMNETFRMDEMQRGEGREQQFGEQGEPGQGQQGQGRQGQGMTPEEFAEALKQLQQGQGQLQGDLEALMKGLEGMGIQPGEGFGEAGEAMGEAEGALGEADGGRAVGEQGRALEALRRGAQDMMQQMQQAMEGDQGGADEGGRQQNADRDPLGRPRATTGPDDGRSVKIPDEIDVQRARQILEAIRKRLGNALSPELERSYLERLLRMQ